MIGSSRLPAVHRSLLRRSVVISSSHSYGHNTSVLPRYQSSLSQHTTHNDNNIRFEQQPQPPPLISGGTLTPHINNETIKTTTTDSLLTPPLSGAIAPLPDFSDPTLAYGTKSAFQLAHSLLILRLCQMRPLVNNAEHLIALSRRILGGPVTDAIVKHTFFSHFCGGEDAEDIRPTIERLRGDGIGSILDYAAESDLEDSSDKEQITPFDNEIPIQPENQPARVYDYKSEALCDEHLRVFRSCIQAVHNVDPDGFAAIKITALGNPLLLERLSAAVRETERLFSKFDADGDGILTRDEFVQGYNLYFSDGKTRLPYLLDGRLDPHGTGVIDLVTWCGELFGDPEDLPQWVSHCRSRGPLYNATPSVEEVDKTLAMRERVRVLAEEAFEGGVRLMIDAEQTRYQPAIDNIVLHLQREFNAVEKGRGGPIVFNTYQAYLKDMPRRLTNDVERSRRYKYHFGAKLVRGAYVVGERAQAAEKGYPSPIHDTIEDTHHCYNSSLEYLLRHSQNHKQQKHPTVEVAVATHNRTSIETCIRLMNELKIAPNDPVVHFAQLYGMSDHLTCALGHHGYRAYKYLPYGSVNEVIPYLVRRGQENCDVFGNANVEMGMMTTELKRRFGLMR